ncbi:MAG: ABC transporter permease [Sphaerospermopsis kisseleviana]|uniref:Putative ABC-2 type transport system permease protein n=1 Tax=Sphaerospermopsis reniformis TaxID=531300 RepID=A0A479ZXY1_9CYAN|nr:MULTISPECIES: ABC transporter permease [Sphaerospermopsis]MBD2145801.1 ABC transporter permease subunit [Sphaerospermopsis sp. FACHB-1194]GCL37072.1 putative ABC-2 type transport system permease protein [Sphaerospermopsis reniformis]
MGIIIANIIAIYRRELQSYFVSPLAYGIAGIFWFISGLFLVMILIGPGGILPTVADLDIQGQQLGVPVPPIDVPYEFIRAFLDRISWLLLFILPILSMGLYAEERKRGTLELLATSPVTNWAVAVGKLLGVLTFFMTMVLPLLGFETLAISGSNPPMSPVIPILGHVGLILLAAAILSLGMFISSLTDSTLLSAVLTFFVVILLLLIDSISKAIPGPVGDSLAHLSLLKHYNTLIQGIFDSSALILFVSYIILGIFLTAQSIDALRFQRQ